jgi:hypothetical protein
MEGSPFLLKTCTSRGKVFRLVILLSLILQVAAFAEEQGASAENPLGVYEQVPREQRESLRQTVEKLVIAQRNRDWETVWQLYDKKQDETSQPYDKRKEENKANFLRKMNNMRRLRSFSFTKITFYPPDDNWIIEGCGSFVGDAAGKGHWSDLHARWINSRWYLSVILIELSKEPGPDGKTTGFRACPAS